MTTLVDTIRPQTKGSAWAFDLFLVFAGSFFLALMSQAAIPLWFTPVPITLQSFAVVLLGALLGSKRGSYAVLLYLAEGAGGLPVFAMGAGGLEALVGPRGGYLVGFVLCAFLVGYLLERGWKGSFGLIFLAMGLGTLVLLACGAAWLGLFVGYRNALALGVYPFLIGAVFKNLAATLLVSLGWRMRAIT